MIGHDLREKLEARIRERHRILAAEMHEDFMHSSEVEGDTAVKDEGEQSVADTLADLNLQRMDQRGRELRALEQALSRMHDGTYGECEECGDSIDPRRLEAQPSSRWCIQCANKLERKRAG